MILPAWHPFFLPSGSSDNPTPACTEGAELYEWMGGLWSCDILTPSIFLTFEYVNNQATFIPSMPSKIVYGH